MDRDMETPKMATASAVMQQDRYDLAMVVRPLFAILNFFHTSPVRNGRNEPPSSRVARCGDLLRLVNFALVAWVTSYFLLGMFIIRASKDLTTDTLLYNFMFQIQAVGFKNGCIFMVTFFKGARLRTAYAELQKLKTTTSIHGKLLAMRRWSVVLGCLALTPSASFFLLMVMSLFIHVNPDMLFEIPAMPSVLAMTLYLVFTYLVAEAMMYTLKEAAETAETLPASASHRCPYKCFKRVERYYGKLIKVTEAVRVIDTVLADILVVTIALEIVQFAVSSRMLVNGLVVDNTAISTSGLLIALSFENIPSVAHTCLLVLCLVKSTRLNDKITSSMGVLQGFLAKTNPLSGPIASIKRRNALFCLNLQINHVTMLLQPIGNHFGKLQYLEGLFLVEICLWTVDLVSLANSARSRTMPWGDALKCLINELGLMEKANDTSCKANDGMMTQFL